MRTTVPIVAALLALSACGESEPMPMTPMTPTVRLAAVPGRPAAGYFELGIDGDRGALVSITSRQAGRIEMHETTRSGSMTSMRPIQRIPVRDGERLVFTSGGRHLMIYDVDPSIRPGGQIILDLNFERGEPRSLAFAVVAAGQDAH